MLPNCDISATPKKDGHDLTTALLATAAASVRAMVGKNAGNPGQNADPSAWVEA